MPGSHVILQDDSPSDEDIKEAAEIAAYFSKGKTSGHVPVDYVQVKRIKKPNGAKPGFVIYTGQNSIEVTPDEHDVLSKKYKNAQLIDFIFYKLSVFMFPLVYIILNI